MAGPGCKFNTSSLDLEFLTNIHAVDPRKDPTIFFFLLCEEAT
jgi:hypothetical protein